METDDDALRVSQTAYRLWVLLSERPGLYHLQEIMRELRCTKTAFLRAAYELEELGIIDLTIEEEQT